MVVVVDVGVVVVVAVVGLGDDGNIRRIPEGSLKDLFPFFTRCDDPGRIDCDA